MSESLTDKIIDNIFKDIDDGDEVTFGFQGGEPTLAGLPWFRHFVEHVMSQKKEAAVHYTFQTNGLLLDEAWCDFFFKNKFLVGLSIDASKRFHNRNRFSVAGEGTHAACLQSKDLLEKNHVEYNILCVLTNDLAKEPERAWRFIISENVRYIQFIPCLDPLDSNLPQKKASGNTLRPMLFAKFYSGLLPWWIKEFEKGNYISIKLFDDVVNYFLKGIPNSCGIDGHCHNHYVIEADGSVYPCDFYAIDRYKTGNLSESTPKELFNTEKARIFLSEKPELSKICATCRFYNACRGGCKRMRSVMYTGLDGTTCGFQFFLEKSLGPLGNAVQRMQHGNIEAGIRP